MGTRAIRQRALININAAPPGGGNAGLELALRYPGGIGNIMLYAPFNTSNYNSLQTQLARRMGSGGLFGLSYTWSKAINYADNNDSGLTWNWVPMRGENPRRCQLRPPAQSPDVWRLRFAVRPRKEMG